MSNWQANSPVGCDHTAINVRVAHTKMHAFQKYRNSKEEDSLLEDVEAVEMGPDYFIFAECEHCAEFIRQGEYPELQEYQSLEDLLVYLARGEDPKFMVHMMDHFLKEADLEILRSVQHHVDTLLQAKQLQEAVTDG